MFMAPRPSRRPTSYPFGASLLKTIAVAEVPDGNF